MKNQNCHEAVPQQHWKIAQIETILKLKFFWKLEKFEKLSRYRAWLRQYVSCRWHAQIEKRSSVWEYCAHTVRACVNMCDTDPEALFSERKTRVCMSRPISYTHIMVAEQLLHGRARPWLSHGTLELRLVVWWSGELRVESVERRAPGRRWRQDCQERAKQSDSDCSVSSESNVGNFYGYESWARRVAPRANGPCRLQRNRWQWPSSSWTCNFSKFERRWQRFSKQREMSLWSKFRMPRRPPHTRRTDETCGSVVQTEIISRSHGPAERAGTCDVRRIVDTETQQGAQHADVPHTRDDDDIVQVSQCSCVRGVRRMEAVRDEMGAKVSWTPDERVVLSM